jgi:hypothetical protein
MGRSHFWVLLGSYNARKVVLFADGEYSIVSAAAMAAMVSA